MNSYASFKLYCNLWKMQQSKTFDSLGLSEQNCIVQKGRKETKNVTKGRKKRKKIFEDLKKTKKRLPGNPSDNQSLESKLAFVARAEEKKKRKVSNSLNSLSQCNTPF